MEHSSFVIFSCFYFWTRLRHPLFFLDLNSLSFLSSSAPRHLSLSSSRPRLLRGPLHFHRMVLTLVFLSTPILGKKLAIFSLDHTVLFPFRRPVGVLRVASPFPHFLAHEIRQCDLDGDVFLSFPFSDLFSPHTSSCVTFYIDKHYFILLLFCTILHFNVVVPRQLMK